MQQVLANMNPSDCTVDSFLSQQVVRPVGTLGLAPLSVPVGREHGPATSVLGFILGTWIIVYLFENKICDSYEF